MGTWRLEPWGQLLQTHSFLLSRDLPTSPTTSHRGQWRLQPPELNGAFESRTPGVSGGHRVRGCLASRARLGEEVSCGSRLRNWWLLERRFILDQAFPEVGGRGARREELLSLYQGGTSVYPLLRRQHSKLRGGRTYEAFATSSLPNSRSYPPLGWGSFPSSLSVHVSSSGAALRYSLSSLLMSPHYSNAQTTRFL